MNCPPVIIVVDDEQAILELIEAQLLPENYEVWKFSDATKALADHELINRCDLIISDVMMPAMNGFEFCQQVRETQHRYLPILIVTALNEIKFRVKGLDSGADDFITKPTNAAELRARVRAHLRTKELNDELQEANRQLKDLGKLRDNLINMIVHDLRNPLQSISMSLALIGNSPNLEYIDETSWELTKQQVNYGFELCEQLLDIKRIQAGEMLVKKSNVAIQPIISQAFQPVMLQAIERGVQVVMPASDIHFNTDPRLLQRILTNLISNAVKHSQRDGSVTVSASASETGVELSVIDQGPGVPVEMQDTIFELFVSAKTRASIQSVGIGLNFCKIASKALGGSIRIVSSPGQGAEFIVNLSSHNKEIVDS